MTGEDWWAGKVVGNQLLVEGYLQKKETEKSYSKILCGYSCVLSLCSAGDAAALIPDSAATGSSISESRHKQFPFPSLDLSCCCYSLSCG